MKICVLAPNLPDNLPYITYYTRVFSRLDVEYDIICWDRNSRQKANFIADNNYVYPVKAKESNSSFVKLFNFLGFRKYILSHCYTHEYDLFVVCGVALALSMRSFLLKSRNYILDIRDYSVILKYRKSAFKALVEKSLINVISSEAYKSWLPKQTNYILSHNVSRTLLEESLNNISTRNQFIFNPIVGVITIGQLRDFKSNSVLIDKLGRSTKFKLKFCGDGIDKVKLEQYAATRCVNYDFTGRYDKSEEKILVNSCDFINILLPENKYIMSQMTNRFYLSIIYRKPMIVNRKSIQGKYVNRYNLGICLDLEEDFENSISEFILNFDHEKFHSGVEFMAAEILEDIDKFESKLGEVLFSFISLERKKV